MNRPGFVRSAVEQSAQKSYELICRVTLVGSTTLANIAAFSEFGDGFLPYVNTTVQPTPVDAGATFGTLVNNASPSSFGLLIMDGFFERLDDIQAYNVSSGTLSGVAFTKAGASTTGITASGNIAVVGSLTGLTLNAAVANHSFTVIARGLRKVPS